LLPVIGPQRRREGGNIIFIINFIKSHHLICVLIKPEVVITTVENGIKSDNIPFQGWWQQEAKVFNLRPKKNTSASGNHACLSKSSVAKYFY